MSEGTDDPVEEEDPVAETSGSRRGKGAAGRARGRAKGTARGRGRGRGRGREKSGEPWLDTNVDDTIPPQPTFRPKRDPGPQLIPTQSYTPLQLFQLFATRAILETVVANTNKFGSRHHGSKWCTITLQDIFSYLAMLIYMGIVKACAIPDYWRHSRLFSLAFPSSVISGRKFSLIATAIHMSDPDDEVNNARRGTPQYDRLAKVKPM